VQREVEGEAEAAKRWLGELEELGAAKAVECITLKVQLARQSAELAGRTRGLRANQQELEGSRMDLAASNTRLAAAAARTTALQQQVR
jgi:hypothetical protein